MLAGSVDALGNPLLRLAFDWKDDEQRLRRFVAARAKELMERMCPSWLEQVEAEPDPYDIHDHPSTHPNDAALYPHNPGANPTGTIGALTYRMADRLLARWFDRPGEILE